MKSFSHWVELNICISHNVIYDLTHDQMISAPSLCGVYTHMENPFVPEKGFCTSINWGEPEQAPH